MRKTLLAMDVNDVADGIRNFQDAVSQSLDLQERITNAHAWYAIKNGDRSWIFAFSKWCGYCGMTTSLYLDSYKELNGRLTEHRLKQWFTQVPDGTPLHRELVQALHTFAARFGRQPNASIRISVVPNIITADEGAPADFVRLLIKVVRSLPPDQRALFDSGI